MKKFTPRTKEKIEADKASIKEYVKKVSPKMKITEMAETLGISYSTAHKIVSKIHRQENSKSKHIPLQPKQL